MTTHATSSLTLTAGPAIARELQRALPDRPVLLYSGRPSAPVEVGTVSCKLSRWVNDVVFAGGCGTLVPAVVDFMRRARARTLAGHCRALFPDARHVPPTIPPRFLLESYDFEVRQALTAAALRAGGSLARGAEALGLHERTYRRWVATLPDPQPRPEWPRDVPIVAWISSAPAPAELARAIDAEGATLVAMPPGCLHARDIEDPELIATILDLGAEGELGGRSAPPRKGANYAASREADFIGGRKQGGTKCNSGCVACCLWRYSVRPARIRRWVPIPKDTKSPYLLDQ